jgi:sirohydrochlorin cobaltochelatase
VTSPQGIVLLAHGSRDARWQEPIEAVARRTAALAPEARVVCAYMELATPDLATAVADLVTGSAAAIRIVPLFLGMGKHAREDLPRQVEALRGTWPGVEFSLSPAVGEDPETIETLARIASRI